MKYYFNTTVKEQDFGKAIDQVTEALKEEGFGVLTTIDVKATLKKKLDEDVNPYMILGACNPHFAHQAMQKENKIGVFLPCNVILQQHDNGEIEVSAVDPIASMTAVDNDQLGEIASQVQEKLARVIADLK